MDKQTRLLLHLQYKEIFDAVFQHLDVELFDSKRAKAVYEAFKEYGDYHLATSTLKSLIGESLQPKSVSVISREYRLLPEDIGEREVEIILGRFEKFLKDKKFETAIKRIIEKGRSDEDLAEMAKIAEFSVLGDNLLDFANKQQVRDMIRVQNDHSVIPSSFSVVNQTLQYNGYAIGQVVMIAAAPGVGKSICMIKEGCHALKKGFKVLSIYLGDLGDFDVLCRWTSCLTGVELIKVAVNTMEYRTQARGFFKNHKAICYPAYELNANDLYHVCRRIKQKFPFDMLIVDYDSNIEPTLESMYQEGGATYSMLDKIAKKLHCLVMVGSQTKNPNWEQETIPLSAAAESSRKQHTIDVMLGIGQNQDVAGIGTINIAKVRRGKPGVKFRVKFNMSKSSIDEITSDEYDRIYMEETSKNRNHKKDTDGRSKVRRTQKFAGGR